MVTAIALQLFPFIFSFELWVEVVVSNSSAESGVSWDHGCWNGTWRTRDHQSDGAWGFGVHTGMGRLGTLPGVGAGAQGAEGALAGAGSVPWPW